MGYTHYTYRPVKNAGSAYMFGKLALDAKTICDYANANGIRIRNGNGEGEPEFTEFYFSINGDAEAFTSDGRDLAHESFYWAGIPTQSEWRKDDPDFFEFCKTAMKPYDAVVTAILIRAKTIYGSCVRISSDGDWHEWQAGRDMYEAIFSEVAECPFERASV
jgi:hypothetical protein